MFKLAARLAALALFAVGGEYYSLDGSGNNTAHPTWGEAGTNLLHIAPVAYGALAPVTGIDVAAEVVRFLASEYRVR